MNIILRFLTRTAIRIGNAIHLVLLLALVSCSSVQQQLDPKLFYKRDIGIEVNGRHYEGVTVIPKADSYQITLRPKGDMDLILVRSCHREYSGEKQGSNGVLGLGLFSKKEFRYTYIPVPGLEDKRVCPLRVDAYESAKGRHSWALLDFESPSYSVQSRLTCNGTVSAVNGVGVCQAKKETVQRIEFMEPIRFAPAMPDGCAAPKKVGQSYEIPATLGECIYHFDTQDGRLGRLIIIGYEGVLIREEQ